ncbi:hypothetical protein PHMEG_00012825 [Phytophthora megakarya]|uniref:Eukaryotic/viral aspartic protease n=1 Tax=Phytophthora megakarya TaxID=4795 RepID=A0A225W7S6_9STRA|nr:hypothetical protein PHMEG_00012825 [Phytophthora megakarya]
MHVNHTVTVSSLRQVDGYARSDVTMTVDLRPKEFRGYWKQQDPDLWFKPADQETTTEIVKPSRIPEYRRSGSTPTLDLLSGESHGYWKHHAHAKIVDKVHNEKTILILDTGDEVSIVNTVFARKVGCYIDWSQIQDCVWIGTITRTKVTLAGSLVYFFDIWVGDFSGQETILGMDVMVPAGIYLDLAHGSISLPDEVRIQISGRRQLYSDKTRIVNLGQYLRMQSGESVELPLRLRTLDHEKRWVIRGKHCVP